MVPGILVLIGKVAFLVALYGFLFVVFRSLIGHTRQAFDRAPGRRVPAEGTVEKWELRPEPTRQTVLVPPVEAPPPTPEPVVPEPVDEAEPLTSGATIELSAADLDIEEKPDDAAALEAPAAEEPAPPPEPAAAVADEPEPEPVKDEHPASLVVLTSPETGLVAGARLPMGHITLIGRADDAGVVLRDRFVSSIHAEVAQAPDGSFVLRDLGSTNGTFCNGARVTGEVPLHDGDRIGIGTSVFTFHSRG